MESVLLSEDCAISTKKRNIIVQHFSNFIKSIIDDQQEKLHK